jgi:hypothetical protein
VDIVLESWCELQWIRHIPCIVCDKLWCDHRKKGPFDLAKSLLVVRLTKRGDVEMNRLSDAEEDRLHIKMSPTALQVTCSHATRTCKQHSRVRTYYQIVGKGSWAHIDSSTYQQHRSDRYSKSHESPDSDATQPSQCCYPRVEWTTWRLARQSLQDIRWLI